MVAAALGVLGTGGAVLLGVSLGGQVGDPPEAPLASVTSTSAVSDGGGAHDGSGAAVQPEATASGPAAPPAAAPSEPATAAPVAPLAASRPVSLSIPSIGVDTEVFPISVAEDGTLPAPRGEQADLAAWFDASPTPGQAGPAIIEGHVTWHSEPSVFFDLGNVQKGDQLSVQREDGSRALFEVYDVGRYPKDHFPTFAVYGRTDQPELRLITCGGAVDSNGRHADNTIVYARLVAG